MKSGYPEKAKRFLGGALLIGALLLGPGQASAAPLTLDQYQTLLRQAVADLEAGRPATLTAESPIEVQTPNGPVSVDLSPLQRGGPAEALPVARQFLHAAEANLTPTPDPIARTELTQILAASQAQGRFSQWLRDLLTRLLFGERGERGVLGALASDRTPWIAGGIGLVGLLILGFFLFRGLRGHGSGADLAARLGRGERSERPLTPNERWTAAQALAESGDWTGGLRTGYLALLQALDKQGLLRYVPAQTNREHERQLRRSQPGLAPTFANLTALVESRLFGGLAATAEDFTAARALIEELWREGDALSRGRDATTGASSSAPSH